MSQKKIFCTALVLFSFSAHAVDETVIDDVNRLEEDSLYEQTNGDKLVDELERFSEQHPQEKIDYKTGKLKEVTFELKNIIVENSTVFTQEELKIIYQDKINTKVDLLDLKTIATAITLKYRKEGYILSFALFPEQDIIDGVVRIFVVEGFIDDVIVIDKTPKTYSLPMVKYSLALLKSKPLTREAYEKFVLLVDDLPGIDIKPKFSPSPDTVYASTLLIDVKEKPVDILISFNNHVSKPYGPHQVKGVLAYNNISYGTKYSVGIVRNHFTRHKKLAYNSFNVTQKVGTFGGTLGFSTSKSETHPFYDDPVSNLLNQTGNSKTQSFSYTHPLILDVSRKVNFESSFSFEKNTTKLVDEIVGQDRLRSINLGITYQCNNCIKFLGNGISIAKMYYDQGIKGLGNKDNSDTIPKSRNLGRIDYSKMNVNLTRLQELKSPFYFLAEANGQYAFHPLLASKEFSFGGNRFGQGYDRSIISGDHGIEARLELFFRKNIESIQQLQSINIGIFYDYGSFWNKVKRPDQKNHDTASSAGASIKLKTFGDFYISLMYAKPLTNKTKPGVRNHKILFDIAFVQ